MRITCFQKFYDDVNKSYEYYFYGSTVYSSENLNEDQVEDLIHYLGVR